MRLLFEELYAIDQIDSVAKSLLPIFKEHGNVLFKGEVGAGKTTLIKRLVALLGISNPVTSPTFGLVNDYEGGGIGIHHFDLYRIDDLQELLNIGWEDYLTSGNWLWVEWPENVPDAFDDSFLFLQLTKTDLDQVRKLQLFEL